MCESPELGEEGPPRRVSSSTTLIASLSCVKKRNPAILIPPDLGASLPSLRANEHAGREGHFVAGDLPAGRGWREAQDRVRASVGDVLQAGVSPRWVVGLSPALWLDDAQASLSLSPPDLAVDHPRGVP